MTTENCRSLTDFVSFDLIIRERTFCIFLDNLKESHKDHSQPELLQIWQNAPLRLYPIKFEWLTGRNSILFCETLNKKASSGWPERTGVRLWTNIGGFDVVGALQLQWHKVTRKNMSSDQRYEMKSSSRVKWCSKNVKAINLLFSFMNCQSERPHNTTINKCYCLNIHCSSVVILSSVIGPWSW